MPNHSSQIIKDSSAVFYDLGTVELSFMIWELWSSWDRSLLHVVNLFSGCVQHVLNLMRRSEERSKQHVLGQIVRSEQSVL